MARLPRYDLVQNRSAGVWNLKNQAGQVIRAFGTKTEATAGGVLKETIGAAGGSIRIHTADGDFQEERTYPRSADPKRSPG